MIDLDHRKRFLSNNGKYVLCWKHEKARISWSFDSWKDWRKKDLANWTDNEIRNFLNFESEITKSVSLEMHDIENSSDSYDAALNNDRYMHLLSVRHDKGRSDLIEAVGEEKLQRSIFWGEKCDALISNYREEVHLFSHRYPVRYFMMQAFNEFKPRVPLIGPEGAYEGRYSKGLYDLDASYLKDKCHELQVWRDRPLVALWRSIRSGVTQGDYIPWIIGVPLVLVVLRVIAVNFRS